MKNEREPETLYTQTPKAAASGHSLFCVRVFAGGKGGPGEFFLDVKPS